MPRRTLEKAKDFKGTLKKLINYLSVYKLSLFIVLLFAISSTVFAIIGPKILGNATTELFNGLTNKISNNGGIDFEKIGAILLTLLGLYILSAIFSLIQGFIMANVTQKITFNLRKDISLKIKTLPMKYFDKKNHGEILSIITNDVDNLSMNLNQSAVQLITSIVTLIGVLVMMISISVSMTLMALIILPLSAILMAFVVKRSQKHFKNQQDYLGHVNGSVEEMYSNHNVVKAYNKEKDLLKTFDKDNDILCESALKSQFLSGLMQPIMGFVGNLGYVGVAVLGGYLVINGRITVGNIQSFIQYMRQFTQPVNQVAQISNMLQSMMASAERIFEFLDEEEEIDVKSKVKLDNVKGNITFDHVKFGYDDKIIINDFNCEVKEGMKVAIVGPTGAGKTTIVKLLMHFYELNGGKILIDGVDIKEINKNTLRHCFGMVLQDTWLFNGTILDNIKYGALDSTKEEVIKASKKACVHHFITTLSKGYEMEINEEASNISQGQKQLITIARAILADPKVLILDEATSSVDTRTEILIGKAMDELMKNRTSFIIAHRLSTIKNADIILVMDKGNIVEVGNHDDLLAKNGFYAKLYNSQFDKVS